MNFKELVRVGKDAEVRATSSGKELASFSVAFDNGWGDNKQTVWLDCTYWGNRGVKVAPYIKKGNQLVVEGDIGTREHEGKVYLTLNVSDVKLVGSRSGGGGCNDFGRGQERQEKPVGDVDFDDDIPFITRDGVK